MLAALKTPTGLSLHIDAANSDGGQPIVRDLQRRDRLHAGPSAADAQIRRWEFELKPAG